MKGLLIKDFKLMRQQKSFFFGVMALVVVLLILNEDVIFPLGFLTFVVSLFAISTISYDDFDNGNAFLFTLPITRAGYVAEKYGLGMLLGGVSWVFAVIIAAAASAVREMPLTGDFLASALVMIPLLILIQALAIPFQLKFGADKGRIAVICSVALLLAAGMAVKNIAKMMFNIDLLGMLDALPPLNMGAVICILIAGAAAILFISMKISISIMKKKEF